VCVQGVASASQSVTDRERDRCSHIYTMIYVSMNG